MRTTVNIRGIQEEQTQSNKDEIIKSRFDNFFRTLTFSIRMYTK